MFIVFINQKLGDVPQIYLICKSNIRYLNTFSNSSYILLVKQSAYPIGLSFTPTKEIYSLTNLYKDGLISEFG